MNSLKKNTVGYLSFHPFVSMIVLTFTYISLPCTSILKWQVLLKIKNCSEDVFWFESLQYCTILIAGVMHCSYWHNSFGLRTCPVLIAWYNGTNSFDSSNGEYKYTKVQGCFYEVAYMLFQSMFSYVKSCSKKLITVASQRVLLWPIDCCI